MPRLVPKFLAKLLVSTILSAALLASGQVNAGESEIEDLIDKAKKIVTPAPGGQGQTISAHYEDYLPEIVFFASAMPPPPSAFKLKQLEKKGLEPDPPDRPVVLGRLYRPESEGPHPAVVLLSAARGISIWDDTWAARLRDWGYLVLDVDSLTPRGLYSHNTGAGETPLGAQKRLLSAYPRSLDAEGARLFLSDNENIKDGRIAVLGMSQGGQAALRAVAAEPNVNIEGRFAAAVALYPACDQLPGVKAPALVLLATEDDWVNIKHCEANLAHINTLEMHAYPDVHHGFDQEGSEKIFPGRNAGYDEEAANDAIARIKTFLALHLGNEQP